MRKKAGIINWIILSALIIGITFLNTEITSSEKPTFKAVIAPQGHIKSARYDLDAGDVIDVNVKVTKGGPVDIYLMTENQYEAAYGGENESINAISYLVGFEDITNISFKFKIPSYDKGDAVEYYDFYEYFDTFFVVVDNRNCTITPSDANSTGTVEVWVNINVDYEESIPYYMDTICIFSAIVVLIIIIVIIVYFFRYHSRKTPQYPPQIQHQQYYYQYPQWPQYPHYPPPEPRRSPRKERRGESATRRKKKKIEEI